MNCAPRYQNSATCASPNRVPPGAYQARSTSTSWHRAARHAPLGHLSIVSGTMDPQAANELFPHIRIVVGMVVGLGITRLLTGIARLIQHPKRHRLSAIHLLWVFSLLVELALFWWWEFAISRMPSLTFGTFVFLIGYALTLFLLCALLFPDDLDEYADYEDYFLNRRRWFFGLFALTFILDVVDTAIKGSERWSHYSADYLVQVPLGLGLCLFASLFADKRLQLGTALLHIAYQAYWVFRVLSAPI
jgi:hypothetical protein